MTYTFSPIAPVHPDHTGFILVAAITAITWIYMMVIADNAGVNRWKASVLIAVFPIVAYFVSYVWTDQSTKEFENTPVAAEFVSFTPEAYNETRHEGKNTRHVDVHEMYVTYMVEGKYVILKAKAGFEYPKHVTLYKN